MSHEQNLELMMAVNAILLPSRQQRLPDLGRLRRAVAAVNDDEALSPELSALRHEAALHLDGTGCLDDLRGALARYVALVRQDDDVIGRVRSFRPGRFPQRAWMTGVAASARALEGGDAQ